MSKLQAVGLQRCFQLDSNTLSHVLDATSAPQSKLEVVTLSHLSLQDWPSNQAAPPSPSPSSAVARSAYFNLSAEARSPRIIVIIIIILIITVSSTG